MTPSILRGFRGRSPLGEGVAKATAGQRPRRLKRGGDFPPWMIILFFPFIVFSQDWSQDAGNAQRTGFTPISPDLPWTFRWVFNGPGPAGGTDGHFYDAPPEARPISGGGNIFIPAGDEGVFAKQLSNGADLWHFTETAVNAALAYDPLSGTVFAGGADGILYRIDAASGTVSGSFDAGSPINKAVLLAASHAFAVSDNGMLHAVHTGSMERTWVYDGGAAAATPPSYSP
jgi:outer membrane protein assembly factor BamB